MFDRVNKTAVLLQKITAQTNSLKTIITDKP